MPAKNIVKQYQENGLYHIYNRGVEKRDIFVDKRDYRVFLSSLKLYLSDPETLKRSHLQKGETLEGVQEPNFYKEIDLLSYCLMPNHFHLLIKQKKIDSMQRFMKCRGTRYSIYFNRRHDRVGSLFQGAYKAVLVENDDYLLHLSRYTHLNPTEIEGSHLKKGETFRDLPGYSWSSYADYLGRRSTKWVKPNFILDIFKENLGNGMDQYKHYGSFVEDYKQDSREFLGKLSLD